MKKIVQKILLVVSLFIGGSLHSQDTIYPNDPDDGFMIPRISFSNENMIFGYTITRHCRTGMVFSPANRGEKIYGFALSGTWLDTSYTLYGYLFQKVGSEYVAVDSVNMKQVSRTRKLMVPLFTVSGIYIDSSYQSYCDYYDSLTNPEYYCCTIQEYYFHDGYPIDSDSFAIAIGLSRPCCDNRLYLYQHKIFPVHYFDIPGYWIVFDSLGTVHINHEGPFMKWQYFPITSRELWLEHVTSQCESVAGLAAEDVDGRTALLHWSGAGGHVAYEVAVGPADSAAESYTVYSVADTEFLYRNMDFGVRYAFRVRGLCQYEDTIETWSPWSGTVQFERPGCYLTLTTSDSLMGYAYGSGYYEPHTDVTIEAFANQGYLFTGWNDSVQDNPRTLTITHDTTFTAYFALDSSMLQGIGEVGTLDFSVTPNPTTGRLTVNTSLADGASAYQVTLLDMSGRTLLSTQADSPVVEMDISTLPAGRYLLLVCRQISASAGCGCLHEKQEQWGMRAIIKN